MLLLILTYYLQQKLLLHDKSIRLVKHGMGLIVNSKISFFINTKQWCLFEFIYFIKFNYIKKNKDPYQIKTSYSAQSANTKAPKRLLFSSVATKQKCRSLECSCCNTLLAASAAGINIRSQSSLTWSNPQNSLHQILTAETEVDHKANQVVRSLNSLNQLNKETGKEDKSWNLETVETNV